MNYNITALAALLYALVCIEVYTYDTVRCTPTEAVVSCEVYNDRNVLLSAFWPLYLLVRE